MHQMLLHRLGVSQTCRTASQVSNVVAASGGIIAILAAAEKVEWASDWLRVLHKARSG